MQRNAGNRRNKVEVEYESPRPQTAENKRVIFALILLGLEPATQAF